MWYWCNYSSRLDFDSIWYWSLLLFIDIFSFNERALLIALRLEIANEDILE